MNILNAATVAACVCLITACGNSNQADAATQSSVAAASPSTRVYIDPVTGKPGVPPPAPTGKAAALTPVPAATVMPTPVYRTHADGTVEMDLNRKQQLRTTLGQDGTQHRSERSVTLPESTP